MADSVAIVGGGLAGLTCAKALAEAGLEVSVFEQLPYYGGRASTYRDADGRWVEQGLHLFLGTYSAFKQVLTEVGAGPDQTLFWMDQIKLRHPSGEKSTFGINPLHAPIKTALRVLLDNDYLSLGDKASALPFTAQAALAIKHLQENYDDRSVTQLWQQSGASKEVLERFARPFCRAIQFTDADDFSAFNFLGWIHHAIYDFPNARLGGYRSARDEGMFVPFTRYLQGKGVQLRSGVSLSEISYHQESRRISGLRFDDGATVTADHYVMALPAWALAPLLPPDLRKQPFFQSIGELPVAPAIAVQLWFSEPVVDDMDFALVGESVVPVYQQQAETYGDEPGTRISTLISPADDYLELSDEELVQIALDVLKKAEPRAGSVPLTKSVVLKHRQHLIRPLPGAMSSRPRQATPVRNLFLAGDWTQQEYFGSQEGAVRSGLACASVLRAVANLG